MTEWLSPKNGVAPACLHALVHRSVVKRRKAWDGGCCSAAQIRDYCFREDTLIERVMWIAHREEMNRIQRRMDPKNHVKVASDDVAAPAVVDEAPPV